jgi:hypothetical protein
VNAEPGRLAAYADLVAAVLDLRSSAPRQTFDAALAEAVAAGTISGDLARRLRQLQRASERAIVEHAEAVLPPALDALQTNVSQTVDPSTLAYQPDAPTQPAELGGAPEPPENEEPAGLGDDAVDQPEEAAPVVQLEARRLLVAGLRTIPDPVHRGTLP